MKAVVIHEFGGPDKVHLEEVPTPEPQPGQVLVRVVAAALNPVDWQIREHLFGGAGPEHMPFTLGQDFAGMVVALGPGAADPAPATRPAITIGAEVLGKAAGTFAEYVTVPVRDVVLKPPSLDFVTAASLPTPALTAWQAVIDTAHARADMHFLVHGAAGSVGSFAAQLARMQGATVTATASRPSFEWLQRIGVNKIIDYQHQRFEEEVRDVDVVIDPFGGDVQARSFQVLKRGGLLINLVGQIDERAAAQGGVLAVTLVMHYDANELREIVGLVERGILLPHVTRVLPLSEARKAMDLNQHGESHGKIVLKVA